MAKKPNLGTFEDMMVEHGIYQNDRVKVEYKRSTGMFAVSKDGCTRLFSDVRDAWRSI